MIGADTNVLVRLVTDDDQRQSERATELFATHDVFLAKTVLLETEWVLRGAYRLDRATIHDVFVRLLATASVTVEAPEAVARAVAWFGAGMDFADALHLSSTSGTATQFATFDRKLQRRAARIEDTPPIVVP